MHRIYKVEVTNDYMMRTTFFNGEVREIMIENDLRRNPSYHHLLKYTTLLGAVTVNKSRTGVQIEGGPTFGYDDLYHGGLLKEIAVIDDINVRLASKVQAMRESKGMTQKDMEKATGIHQSEISKIERAVGNPSIATIHKLAVAAEHDMDVFFTKKNIRRDVAEVSEITPFLNTSKYQGEYVISDLDDIPEDIQVELIEGCIYDMAPPTTMHQEVVGEISFAIRDFIKKNKGKCIVLDGAGLNFENDDKNLLIPDIMVVCDKNKPEYKNVVGVADFVIEVASPGNCRRDYGIKQAIYMSKGVREYWIIDAKRRKLVVYLNDGESFPEIHTFDEMVDVGIYKGKLKIDLQKINEIVSRYL